MNQPATTKRLAAWVYSGSPARHGLLVFLFYSFLFTLFFSPVIFFGRLLAPGGGRLGDGLLYHVAYFLSDKLRWDPLLAGGFPMIADPQVAAWYPPALLFSFVPGGWNIFVVSAYVLASCFTYGYVYTVTKSRIAALAGGMVYGMCGFMMAHLGHTTIIHVAAWLPLLIWSIEMLRQKITLEWIAIGVLAVACCVLAGHLQIVSYSLVFAGTYAVVFGWNAPVGRWRFYSVYAMAVALGIGLTAIQMLPAMELARFSTRSNFTFSDFASYSLPYKHLLLLLFPASFGGLPRYGTTPYFGDWNLTEVSSYVGVLTLVLAALGLIARRDRKLIIFWLCAGVAVLLLALGDGTPLARLIYQLPVIGKFRAPARHVFELALVFSVLAGFGIDGVLRQQISRRIVLVTVFVGTAVMAVGLLSLRSMPLVDLRPWSNPALSVPLILFVAAAGVLFYWHKQPRSVIRQGLVLILLGLDLASFGWFYAWHDFSPVKEVLTEPGVVKNYKDTLNVTRQRMVSARGTLGGVKELPPNLSRLWGVSNANGYGPLTLSTVTDLLSLLPDSSLAPQWQDRGNQSLNLAAVRYVFLPPRDLLRDQEGVLWEKGDLNIWLGSGCNQPPRSSVKFRAPGLSPTSRVTLVTRLACSTGIADGEEMARLIVSDPSGVSQTIAIKAGQHTSEWAYDCPNVKPDMKHSRAPVFSTFPTKMYDTPCEGHFYKTEFHLEKPVQAPEVELQWVGQNGAMSLEKISLGNEEGSGWIPLNAMTEVGSTWRVDSETNDVRIYENMTVLPRAWLATDAVVMKPEDILKTIKTSVLPNGKTFAPAQTVLVEEPLAPIAKPDATGYAYVGSLTDTTMEVRTSSGSESFLVTSDTWYPGWQATVDGVPASIFRANYALRGVRVPAGRHIVRFEYRPKMLFVGTAVSVFCLVILAGILAVSLRQSRRESAG
ncbi:MAG TPA: YfhO family protein [Pyrinomonadaceae bacterium]|nr:YfhO family protein [Pyrinomonadaceae bacterium]